MKRCGRCKKSKDEAKFYKNLSRKDGLNCWCKKCRREYNRNYYGRSKRYLSYEQRHRVVGRVKQKRCSKCQRWKAVSKFYKMRQQKDGLAAWCKPCSDKATNKAHKQRLAVRS